MNGIILVNKPIGKTSHDIVSIMRRLTGIRRIGHTGTLDPMAEGVLPVCIGNATKVSDMLTNADKKYTAELILGMTTDTLDAEGEVITECAVDVTEEQIKDTINSFIGEIEQIPPMYSAIKKDGKKLYELAREGKTAEREARRINIYDIKITDINNENNSVTIDVHCSKGTYIRTLCEDIGLKLKVGAYMNKLTRTETAGFNISNCYTLAEINEFCQNGTLNKMLIPTDSVFYKYPEIRLNEKQSARIKNGVFVSAPGIEETKKYRVYDNIGQFICVAQCIEGRLHIIKSFR